MLEKYLRPLLQRVVIDLLAGIFIRVDPSFITLMGCVLGVLSSLFLCFGYGFAGFLFMALSGLSDMLDGSVARLSGKSTDFGCALDIVSDRIVECALVIGLYYYAGENPLYPLLMLSSILICVTTFLVVGIFSENKGEKSFHYSRGLMERGEAFLFFALMIASPSFYSVLAALFSSLVLLTAIIRLTQFYQVTRPASY